MGFSSSPPAPSKPLFFKVLLPGSLKRLSVPPKFVRKHLSHVNLSKNRATIKSPLGRSWDVCVHVNKEGHFFEDGWCVFVRDHDLHMGDFLVFKYKGCLDFNVKLFDSSGCEKEYPPSARNRSEEHTDWTKIDKPPTTSPSCVKQGSSNDEHRMKSVKLTTDPIGSASLKRQASHEESEVEFKKQMTMRISSQRNGSPCLSQILSFKISIKPSNLVEPYMYIPVEFIESNGFENGTQVLLRDPKERLWEVQIYYKCRNKNWSQFQGQWHEFVIANGLQSGDVCVFELIGSGEKDVLNVRILNGQSVKNNDSEEFKTKVEASTHSYDCEIKLKKQVTRCLQQMDATKEENVLPRSTHRCFKVSINPFNLMQPYMSIPHEFIESNGLQHTCRVRMTNANGRPWEVSILHMQNNLSRFTGGWQKFLDNNGFKVGDVLVFEINPDDKDIIIVKMDENVVLV